MTHFNYSQSSADCLKYININQTLWRSLRYPWIALITLIAHHKMITYCLGYHNPMRVVPQLNAEVHIKLAESSKSFQTITAEIEHQYRRLGDNLAVWKLSAKQPHIQYPCRYNLHVIHSSPSSHFSPLTGGTCYECSNTMLPESYPQVDYVSPQSVKDGWRRLHPLQHSRLLCAVLCVCVCVNMFRDHIAMPSFFYRSKTTNFFFFAHLKDLYLGDIHGTLNSWNINRLKYNAMLMPQPFHT